MTCAVDIQDQKRSLRRRTPCAPVLMALGVALTLSSGLPSRDPFALVCDALTSVVSATWNLFFAFSDSLSALGILPDALRPAAAVTHYPSLLYASDGIGAEPAFLWRGTLALGAWALSATLCAELAFRRARGQSVE